MKKKRLWNRKGASVALLLMLAAVLLPMQAAAQGDTLCITLEQALEIAMTDNLSVQIAGMEVRKQEYAKKGTYAALFPQIDFGGSYQRTIEKQTMYMDGAIPSMSSDPEMENLMDKGIQVGRQNVWSTGFTASAPLISVPLW